MIVRYVNSNGVEVNLNKEPYRMLVSDILDYDWEEISRSDKIIGFRKGINKKAVNIDILKDKNGSARKHLSELTDVFELDIYSKTPGKLYIDEYYLNCFFYANKKSNWETDKLMSCEYGITTDYPCWVREKYKRFGGAANSILSDYGFDYSYDYAYDYASSLLNQRLVVDGPTSSHFVMIIYGSCENPAVSIGTHTYKVNTSLITGEYLTIDSMKKKITKTTNYGEKINVYDLRDRTYINFFEKIPAGPSPVAWSGSFGFDITLYMERSEPAWT